MKPFRWYAPYAWMNEVDEKISYFTTGSDEFWRDTFCIRIPGTYRVIVIPYRNDRCEDADVARGENNGYRFISEDGDSDMVDYIFKIHKVSRNRLPLHEFIGWTEDELSRYYCYGIIPSI